MNTGITILVVFLVVVFRLGFPRRGQAERAYLQKPGPHPLVRPFLAVGRWRRQRREQRRRRHLKRV